MLMVKSTLLWVIDDAASVAKRRNLLHRRRMTAKLAIVPQDAIGHLTRNFASWVAIASESKALA
jgi:hypothetical protein